MSDGYVVVSKWWLGLLVPVVLSVLAGSGVIIYSQGQINENVKSIVASIKDLVKNDKDQDIALSAIKTKIGL